MTGPMTLSSKLVPTQNVPRTYGVVREYGREDTFRVMIGIGSLLSGGSRFIFPGS
jgi:hypothetical protein